MRKLVRNYPLSKAVPKVDRKDFKRFFSPNVVYLLVTRGVKNYVNVAPVTWITPLSYDPAAIVVCLKKKSDSARNIRKFRDFSICVPDKSKVQDVHNCAKPLPYGKSEIFLTRFQWTYAYFVDGFTLQGMWWMECTARRVERCVGLDHFLVIADVIHCAGKKVEYKDLILETGFDAPLTEYRDPFGNRISVNRF